MPYSPPSPPVLSASSTTSPDVIVRDYEPLAATGARAEDHRIARFAHTQEAEHRVANRAASPTTVDSQSWPAVSHLFDRLSKKIKVFLTRKGDVKRPRQAFHIWKAANGRDGAYEMIEIPPKSYTINWNAHPAKNGGFANVYEGTWKNHSIALKQLKAKTLPHKLIQRFDKEVQLWCALSHTNILSFLGVFVDPSESMYMVSPWCSNGDLIQYLQSMGPGANRMSMLLQVANGVAYLHDKNIAHGDLRGANILVSDNGEALLADFGLSKFLMDANVIVTNTSLFQAGAGQWMAPELMTKRPGEATRVTKEADIYAFGITVIEAYTGGAPYGSHWTNELQLYQDILSGLRPERPLLNTFSDSLWDLVQECWDTDLDHRPDVLKVRARLQGADYNDTR